MRKTGLKALVAGALLALGACGNDPNTTQPLDVARGFVATLKGPAGSPPVSDAQIAAALNGTTGPLILAKLPDMKTEALMLQSAQNGAYATYATSTRQTFVLRDGMITNTRGIGGDLMSSEPQALLALLRSGQQGTVPYVMRFLSGEDVTYTYRYDCAVSPAGPERVSRGLVSVEGRRMNAACTGDGPYFLATFVMDGEGRIVKSDQWLGDHIGRGVAQAIRR